jgi:hypothetical protein
MKRTETFTEFQAHGCADAARISRWTAQTNPQTRLGSLVMKKLGGGPVLRDHQIDATVLVEVPDRGTALFAINSDSGFGRGNSCEVSVPVPPQPQTQSCIESRVSGRQAKKLAQKRLVPVAVHVRTRRRRRPGQLRFEKRAESK